jgi:ABC-type multidrug transport system fused ATPase/permease subunit
MKGAARFTRYTGCGPESLASVIVIVIVIIVVVIIIVIIVVVVVIVVIVIVIVVVVIVIVVVLAALVRAVVDDLQLWLSTRNRRPEVAEDLAGSWIQDDFAQPVAALCADADAPQQGAFGDDRAEALAAKLSDDVFNQILGKDRRRKRDSCD